MGDDNAEIAPEEDIIATTDVCIVRRDKGRTHSLTLGELAELMALYRAKYPNFARLEAMYEAEKHCARLAGSCLPFHPCVPGNQNPTASPLKKPKCCKGVMLV